MRLRYLVYGKLSHFKNYKYLGSQNSEIEAKKDCNLLQHKGYKTQIKVTLK